MAEFIKKLFFLIALLVSVQSEAKFFTINLFSQIQSKTVYRGALIWDKPSFFVGPGLVFYEKLFVNGPSLQYKVFKRKNKSKLNFGTSFFNDRRPFFKFDSDEEGIRNSRRDSFNLDLDFGYKFGFMDLFELGFSAHQEIVDYKGFYLEPYFDLPVFPYVKLTSKVGIGESSSNKYLYGETAEPGLGYYSVGLLYVWPKFFKKGTLLLSIDHISITGKENRSGALVSDANQNFNFSIRYFCKLY